MGDYWTAAIGGMRVSVRLSRDSEGRPVDLHASMGPPGSSLALAVEAVTTAASINLRAGVPMQAITRKWAGQRFDPAGPTGDPSAPQCTSVVDYLARAITAREQ